MCVHTALLSSVSSIEWYDLAITGYEPSQILMELLRGCWHELRVGGKRLFLEEKLTQNKKHHLLRFGGGFSVIAVAMRT